MARKAGPRLSLAPLLGALTAKDIEVEALDAKSIAAVKNAKTRGYMTLDAADDIACHVLKVHPFDVWGQEYEDVVWYDMADAEQSNVIALFPEPTPNPEPVYAPLAVAA